MSWAEIIILLYLQVADIACWWKYWYNNYQHINHVCCMQWLYNCCTCVLEWYLQITLAWIMVSKIIEKWWIKLLVSYINLIKKLTSVYFSTDSNISWEGIHVREVIYMLRWTVGKSYQPFQRKVSASGLLWSVSTRWKTFRNANGLCTCITESTVGWNMV